MPQDVPQFMQTMVDEDAGTDVLEPLRNDILTDETGADEKIEDKPVETDNNSGEPKPTDAENADGSGEDGKKQEAPTDDTNKQPVVPPEDASKKEVPTDNAKSVEKTAEQIEAVARGEGNEKLKQAVAIANKFPLVDVPMPKAKDYVLDDGSIDLDAYGKQLIGNTVMAFQKSLIAGPLSAALYGVLNTAMTEEQSAGQQEKEATEYASGIYNKLVENFPRLKEDKDIEESFDSLLQGENLKRAKLAEQMAKEGKTLPRMAYEDYEKLLIKLVGKREQTQNKEELDPVETMKGGVVMNGGIPGTQDSSDPDIDAMMRVKSKNLFS